MPLSASEQSRYHRHLALPELGKDGQERLKAARVLVIGAGGLGSPAALYLAAAGVGTLGLVDCDRVELSNLQRQVLFDTAAVGRLKTEAARERLLALNPEISVVAHTLTLRAENVLEVLRGYDLVLDGTDRLATRYLVNDACVLLGKPLVSAAIHRFEGHAMTYLPGRGPCYRCLFPAAEEGVVGNCAEAGVLGVLPGVLGAIQATEAIKIATGVGEPIVGRLVTYDALELRFVELPVTRRADCAVCGEHPTITAPRDAAELCDTEALAQVRRLTASALSDLLASELDSAGLVLVDVREPQEFNTRHLQGARNIPLADLARRLGELAGERTPVFVCRSGRRSLMACALALRGGMAAPAHLEGGLLAWAADVDPAFEVAAG
ncbi:MAG TPA: molybdopterin-synthase adenylyltransferase MoeB [Steroidobacteraceae bacterium]|nr:molybdopterin-synthase adenylyltransferase MoeB [Steroidobacteraceae bacterium]